MVMSRLGSAGGVGAADCSETLVVLSLTTEPHELQPLEVTDPQELQSLETTVPQELQPPQVLSTT
jgi:hypothetical protein